MRRPIKWLLATMAMFVAIVGGTVAPANAWVVPGMNTEYPNAGGTWEYGFQNLYLRSYYTVDMCHGSTVFRIIDGDVVNSSRSVDTAAGYTSIAEVYTVNSPGLSAEYYYRTC